MHPSRIVVRDRCTMRQAPPSGDGNAVVAMHGGMARMPRRIIASAMSGR